MVAPVVPPPESAHDSDIDAESLSESSTVSDSSLHVDAAAAAEVAIHPAEGERDEHNLAQVAVAEPQGSPSSSSSDSSSSSSDSDSTSSSSNSHGAELGDAPGDGDVDIAHPVAPAPRQANALQHREPNVQQHHRRPNLTPPSFMWPEVHGPCMFTYIRKPGGRSAWQATCPCHMAANGTACTRSRMVPGNNIPPDGPGSLEVLRLLKHWLVAGRESHSKEVHMAIGDAIALEADLSEDALVAAIQGIPPESLLRHRRGN